MTPRASTVSGATHGSVWHRLTRSALAVAAAIAAVVASLGAGEAGSLVIDFRKPQTMYLASSAGIAKSDDGGATWTPRNVGFPVSERPLFVTALVMDPIHPTTLYAGTQDLGIFKTTDGAASWIRVSEKPIAVTALAIDPRTPARLYAAAGQGMSVSAARVEYHSRVFKSENGGKTWAVAGTLSDVSISLVVIAPDAPRTVYAVTSSAGVQKSGDGGATWQAATSGITSRSIAALVLDVQRPGRLYAGTDDRGVFRSDDGGARWIHTDRGLTSKMVIALAVDPAAPSLVYAVASGTSSPEVFRSVDAGSTWSRVGVPAGAFPGGGLTVDPLTPSTLYLSGGGRFEGAAPVWKSLDGGVTWARANASPTEITPLAIAVDPADPDVLYAAVSVERERGLFKSTNGGASWTRSTTGLDGDVMVLAADPRDRATLYAGVFGGVFKTSDGGMSWMRSGVGVPTHDTVNALAVDPKDPATVYLGTLNSGIFKSIDGGRSWQRSAAGLDSHTVRALAVDPHRAGTVYAVLEDLSPGAEWVGGPRTRERIGGVWKSSDGGATWRGSDAGLPLHVQALALEPRTPDVLYAIVRSGGVFQSRDGGATWTARRTLPSTDVRGLLVGRPSTVYAWTTTGLFRTADGGTNWSQASPGPATDRAPAVLAFAVNPRNPDVVYAGTATGGLYKSSDGGRRWQPINQGLVVSGQPAAGPKIDLSKAPRKLISSLPADARHTVEGLAIGERSQITVPDDCNTCRCIVERTSPTEYVSSPCGCTLMLCPSDRARGR